MNKELMSAQQKNSLLQSRCEQLDNNTSPEAPRETLNDVQRYPELAAAFPKKKNIRDLVKASYKRRPIPTALLASIKAEIKQELT